MSNKMTTLFAVGSVPTLRLRNKVTKTTIDFSHINGATSDITVDSFSAKLSGISAISFNSPAVGVLNISAESTSDFIRKEVYGLGLIEPKIGNGVTVFNTQELILLVGGKSPAIDVTKVPLNDSMSIYNEDRSVQYKIVTGVPTVGQASFDKSTRIITIGEGKVGDVILIDGDVLDETKKKMSYIGNPKPIVFEGFLDIFKTDETGEVTMETYYYPKLTVKPSMKIEATADSVSTMDLEFTIEAEKRGNEYVMVDIIS